MPYLIQGSRDTVFNSFNLANFVTSEANTGVILKDIERTQFFGSAQDCQLHIDAWNKIAKNEQVYYSQGDMSAGNLFLLFGLLPFLNKNEAVHDYGAQKVNICFAFVDKNKVLNGLNLLYRKDDPSKWMIGLIKNTNGLPSKPQLYVFTNGQPLPELNREPTCNISSVNFDDKTLFTAIQEPLLEQFLAKMISPGGLINPKINFIEQFTQYVAPLASFQPNTESLALLRDNMSEVLSNKALQIIQQASMHVDSPQQIIKCMDTSSLLYQKICSSETVAEEERAQYINVTLHLDDIGLLSQWETIFKSRDLFNQLGGIWLCENIDSLKAMLACDDKIDFLNLLAHNTNFPQLFRQVQDLNDETAIQRIMPAITLLNTHSSKPEAYELALQQDAPGYEFRCLLRFIATQPALLRAKMIAMSFNAISTRKRCVAPGFEFAQRINLILRLRDLDLGDEMIDLLLQNTQKGELFFKAIREVELGCQNIRKRLEFKAPEKYQAIQPSEREYRVQMHTMLYDHINQPNPRSSMAEAIAKIEQPFLAAANIDRHPWLRKAMLVIANAITILCTFKFANKHHERISGDFLFFARPSSAEAIKKLNIEVIDMVTAPAA